MDNCNMQYVISWFPQARKYYFPGQNYHFPGQRLQDLNIIIIINNNCKTSIAPISSKRIKLSGALSTGVGQTYSLGTMPSSSPNDRMEWKN